MINEGLRLTYEKCCHRITLKIQYMNTTGSIKMQELVELITEIYAK